MPRGLPRRASEEAARRSQLVRVSVRLELGALEDLELLMRYRHPGLSRAAVIREAVTWLRAREAASLVRYRDVDDRRRRRAREEARALALSRQERDQGDAADRLAAALAIARGPTKGVGQ